MAISVDWGARIINILFADLEWVQDTPTVIRKLDLNVLRLALKDLEDGEDGMPHPDTHRHNTEVSLGGLTYARVVEIINSYTVTFEDGQYAVNLYGANSNVADVVNVNQVSVRAFNSAGLISNPAIEYASFNGGVTIDVNSLAAGTIYNVGTPENPVNNLADAKLIAASRGFNKLYIVGNFTFPAGANIDSYIISGDNLQGCLITIESGCSTEDVRFEDVTVQGALSGNSCCFHKCKILALTGFHGTMFESILADNITLAGSGDITFINCSSGVPGSGTPEIDMGGSGRGLGVRAYAGGLLIKNKSGSENVSVDFIAGQLKLASTVTNGTIVVRGVGKITVNESVGTDVQDYGLVVGDKIARALGLSQENFRIKSQVYDANKNMTSATVRLYANAADCEADVNQIAEYTIAATYDAENNCTSYKVKQV